MNTETKKGLTIAGTLVGGCIAITGLAHGLERLGNELDDMRQIAPQRIEVRETYGGFFSSIARFDWVRDGKAWIRSTDGDKTIVVYGACDRNIYLAFYGSKEVASEQAKEELGGLCEVLDCDGICRDWKKASEQL
ncbi:MAG: hypothetical protein QME12_04470 [Nanoarchaeota archaeon]|nr:hypothetical protein [Nanoarchaeota archaeon]